MRIPLAWLRDYVDCELPTDELAEVLNMAGLEIEGVESFARRDGSTETVLDGYVTPNRGDWLSIVGVAREAAACLNTPLNAPSSSAPESVTLAEDRYDVTIDVPSLCPRYVGLLVTDVTVGPSPDWLVDRIEAAGIRSVSNVVDITNYVLLEQGQPLHAFDFEKLAGPQIIVRTARPDETITAIDGKERKLTRDDLVIADAAHAVALAGVMGGLETEVSESTTSILIESAHFSPASIRRTAAKQAMRTEASFRFERSVDPNGCARAAWRAAELMQELCGASVEKREIDRYPAPPVPAVITLRPARCNALLGTDLSVKQIADYLQRLHLPVEADKQVQVTAPSFRPDLKKEVDLIEEVARMYGYNGIDTTLPRTETVAGGRRPLQKTADAARDLLLQCGLWECWTYSLVGLDALDRINLPEDHPRRHFIALQNPLSLEASALRTMLAPSLLQVLEYNARWRSSNMGIFEVGRIYLPTPEGDRADERLTAGIILTGSPHAGSWNMPEEQTKYDFFALKGIVEGLLGRLAPSPWVIEACDGAPFRPGSAARITMDGVQIGRLGSVDDLVLANYGVSEAVLLAEVDLQPFIEARAPIERYRPIPRFPDVTRDLAFVVDTDVAAGAVRSAIIEVGGESLAEVSLFDLYDGKQLEGNKKSLAFSLAFRSTTGTLTDEVVDAEISNITDHLTSKLGATLRA